MDMMHRPTELALPNGEEIRIERLPAQTGAVKGFLDAQAEALMDECFDMECTAQDGTRSRVAEEDLNQTYDSGNSDTVAFLLKMAKARMDHSRNLGSLLLRAVKVDPDSLTVGTLNMKFSDEPAPDRPAAVLLHNIGVRGDYQRQGIAGAMLGAALRLVKPYPRFNNLLGLVVLDDNKRAIAWYDKLGINPDGHTDIIELGKRAVQVSQHRRVADIDDVLGRLA
jgi:ribosomal protein S18 acetylase RimI-like enzyme